MCEAFLNPLHRHDADRMPKARGPIYPRHLLIEADERSQNSCLNEVDVQAGPQDQQQLGDVHDLYNSAMHTNKLMNFLLVPKQDVGNTKPLEDLVAG